MILLSLLAIALSMGFQDVLATCLVVAESRNLGKWAGRFDAANDVASRVGTIVTAGLYVKHGWGWQTFAALAVTCVTSYFATSKGTSLAHRLMDHLGAPSNP